MPGPAPAGSRAMPSAPPGAPASLAAVAVVGSSAPHSLQYASPGTVAAPQLGQTPPAGKGPEAFPASNAPLAAGPPIPPVPPVGPLIVLTGVKPAGSGAGEAEAGMD